MIRIRLLDGNTMEIPREEALELLPYRGVFVSPMLKGPIEGLLVHRGKLVPVLGPLPLESTGDKPPEERTWILLLKGCAQVTTGLPEFLGEGKAELISFPSAKEENSDLLEELDNLIKSA